MSSRHDKRGGRCAGWVLTAGLVIASCAVARDSAAAARVGLLCSSQFEGECHELSAVLMAHFAEYQVSIDLTLLPVLPESFYDQMESARAALKFPGTVAVLWLDDRLSNIFVLIAPPRASRTDIPVTEQLMSRALPPGGFSHPETAELIATLTRSCLATWLERRADPLAPHRQERDDELPTEAAARMARRLTLETFAVSPVVGFVASPLTEGGNWLAGNRVGLETWFANTYGTSIHADVYWPGQLPLPSPEVYESYRFSFRISSHLYRTLGSIRLGIATSASLDFVPTLDKSRELSRVLPVLGLSLQAHRQLSPHLTLWAEVGLDHPLNVINFTHSGDIIDRTAILWPRVGLGVGLPLSVGSISTPATPEPSERWPDRSSRRRIDPR